MVFLRVEQSNNEKLPYVHGKVVFLHVEQSKNKKLPHVHGEMVFLCLEKSKKAKKQMTSHPKSRLTRISQFASVSGLAVDHHRSFERPMMNTQVFRS